MRGLKAMAVTAPREKLFQEMTRSRAWPQGHRGGKGGLGRVGEGGGQQPGHGERLPAGRNCPGPGHDLGAKW